MSAQATDIADSIGQMAAELAADGLVRRERVEAQMAAIASQARALARPDVEAEAAAAGAVVCDASVPAEELFRAVTRSIENLQAMVAGTPAADPAPTGLSAIAQDPELIADFVHEAREHLESIEAHLLAVGEDRNSSEAVNAIFRSFHTIKGLAGFLELPLIQSVAHETETVLDLVRQGKATVTPAAVDIILESRDYISRWLKLLAAGPGCSPGADLTNNAALLERIRNLATGEEPRPVSSSQPLAEAPATEAPPAPEARKQRNSSVKVDTAKLDYLVDMVGESVIAQSLLQHDATLAALNDARISRNLATLARLTAEVQRTVMAMRMVPIGPLFQKMARLVRDLSRKCGKRIAFESSGEDVELDRNIVEELADPLMHMVRNSVDHGIEPANVREAAGKDATGRISLKAFHRSGQIVIDVADDGRGLQRKRILDKARERGLLAQGAAISDTECLNLIFHPGFSTAERVSDLSGRGVGMDVVRRQIQNLRGSVDIDSVEGAGTRFSLRLPLTLATIDGLVVKVGGERYIVPLAPVRQILRPSPGMVTTIEGKAEVVSLRDHLLPLVRLHQKFGIEPACSDPCGGVLIVIDVDGMSFCLLVDELIGKQEVVIKGLGPVFQGIAGVAGGAILGDGHIGLILDMKGVFTGSIGIACR
jgi:two-component system, chemotaxis family, sensor kinase CheA